MPWGVKINEGLDGTEMLERGVVRENESSPNCCVSLATSSEAWIPTSSGLRRENFKDLTDGSPVKAPAGPSTKTQGGGPFAMVSSASKYKPTDPSAIWEAMTTSRAVKTSSGGHGWGGPPSRETVKDEERSSRSTSRGSIGGDVGDALHERMRRLDSLMGQASTSHAARPMACGQESSMMQGRSSAFALISQQRASHSEYGRNELERHSFKAPPAFQSRDSLRSYQAQAGAPPLPSRACADDMPRPASLSARAVQDEVGGGLGALTRRMVYSNTEW